MVRGWGVVGGRVQGGGGRWGGGARLGGGGRLGAGWHFRKKRNMGWGPPGLKGAKGLQDYVQGLDFPGHLFALSTSAQPVEFIRL